MLRTALVERKELSALIPVENRRYLRPVYREKTAPTISAECIRRTERGAVYHTVRAAALLETTDTRCSGGTLCDRCRTEPQDCRTTTGPMLGPPSTRVAAGRQAHVHR